MVEPTLTTPSCPRAWRGLVLALALNAAAGCSLVPKSRLDECRKVAQNLRAENGRLKDVALDLRSQNQDLSQRAVDDARRIAVQDEAVTRLERSVQAYQADRDKLADAFEGLMRQVRTTVSTHQVERLETFAQAHPGWSFDASRMSLSAETSALFAPGTNGALRPEAIAGLNELATTLSTEEGTEVPPLEVLGHFQPPPLLQTGFDVDDPGIDSASGRFLNTACAARVRKHLLDRAKLAPERIRLVPTPAATSNASLSSSESRIEIRLVPLLADAPASVQPAPLDSVTAAGR